MIPISLDSSSTKSVNDSGPFSFPIGQQDISSFEPMWDCSGNLDKAASLGQPVNISALGETN